MIRFLADENFLAQNVQRLRSAGHDVEAVAEKAPGMADVDVLAWADREQRVLLTFDRDFGKILYGHHAQYKHLAGLIYLRFIPTFPTEPAEEVLALIQRQHPPIREMYVIIERKGIRSRPLP